MLSAPALPHVPPPSDALRYVVLQPHMTPPGGWCYLQQETRREWTGVASIDLLAQEVALHRTQNGILPGDPYGDVMHFTGALLIDRGLTRHVEVWQPVERRLGHYWQGFTSLARLAKLEALGRPIFVSQDVAEQRAAICWSCPKNVVDTAATKAKRLTDAQLRKAVGGRTTSLDGHLHTCAVCTCVNATLVHFSSEVIALQKVDKRYPPHCWKHRAVNPL